MMEKNLRLMVDIFDPEWVQLGMDEIWVINNEKGRMGRTEMTNEQIVAFAFNKAFEIAQQVKPGIKVMLWSDMFDDRQTPDWYHPLDEQRIEEVFASDASSKSIYMMPWYYNRSQTSMQGSTHYFLSHGFPVLPASGHDPLNNYEWANAIATIEAGPDTLPGILYTVWYTNDVSARLNGIRAHSIATWSTNQIRFPSLLRLQRHLQDLGLAVESGQELPDDAERLKSLYYAAARELEQIDTQSLEALAEPGLETLFQTMRRVQAKTEGHPK